LCACLEAWAGVTNDVGEFAWMQTRCDNKARVATRAELLTKQFVVIYADKLKKFLQEYEVEGSRKFEPILVPFPAHILHAASDASNAHQRG